MGSQRGTSTRLSTTGLEQCVVSGKRTVSGSRILQFGGVIDQIVADGKAAIPVLISQITDSRWISEPVYDFWPRIRAGELARFILRDLFLDDTRSKSTIPPLFPERNCTGPAGECWQKFRRKHSLKELQARWEQFWNASQARVYWDAKARCFRLSIAEPELPSRSMDCSPFMLALLPCPLTRASRMMGFCELIQDPGKA